MPSVFTRLDKRMPYSYTEKKYISKAVLDAQLDDDFHHKKRAERTVPMNRYNFSLTDDIPTGPSEHYLEQKRLKLSVNTDMEEEYQLIVSVCILPVFFNIILAILALSQLFSLFAPKLKP